MRVAGTWDQNLLSWLERIREQSDTAAQQLATGRRVDLPGDDPGTAAAWVEVRARLDAVDRFSRNLGGLRALVDSADSALNSAVLVLNRAIALGTQGGSGTVSEEQRRALAEEVGQLHAQLVDLANTSLNGVYLFAGTAVATRPFVADASVASGVRYEGNGNSVRTEVAPGELETIQLPGSEVFAAAGADAFEAVAGLQSALENGGDVAAATAAVKSALDHVSIQRIRYGAARARLNEAEQRLGQEEVWWSGQENDLIGADLARAASEFARAQTALNAALQAGSKTSRLSLLDFLS